MTKVQVLNKFLKKLGVDKTGSTVVECLRLIGEYYKAEKGDGTISSELDNVLAVAGGSTEELNCNLNLSNVKDSSTILNSYMSYLKIDDFPTGIADFTSLFSRATSITFPIALYGLNKIDASNATLLVNTFNGMYASSDIDLSTWDTSKVTSINRMFEQLKFSSDEYTLKLDGKFNISNVTTMNYAFRYFPKSEFKYDCFKIESKVTSLNGFLEYSKCTSIDLTGFKTPDVTDLTNMFDGCGSLTTLLIPDMITTNVTKTGSMFSACSRLVNVTWGSNWLPNTAITKFDLTSSYKLSHDSILDLFNKLAIRTDSPTLSLASTAKARMSADEIKIATDKGWTVA